MAAANVVSIKRRKMEEAPIIEETQRPYRLWNSEERRDEPHRYYATERRALDSALLLVRWAKVGVTLEVYDCRVGRCIGIYKRGVNSISFTPASREASEG